MAVKVAQNVATILLRKLKKNTLWFMGLKPFEVSFCIKIQKLTEAQVK